MQNEEGVRVVYVLQCLLTCDKMVEAGWCYDPSPEFDDGVTCFYCNLSLDGWEPKDNPL